MLRKPIISLLEFWATMQMHFSLGTEYKNEELSHQASGIRVHKTAVILPPVHLEAGT